MELQPFKIPSSQILFANLALATRLQCSPTKLLIIFALGPGQYPDNQYRTCAISCTTYVRMYMCNIHIDIHMIYCSNIYIYTVYIYTVYIYIVICSWLFRTGQFTILACCRSPFLWQNPGVVGWQFIEIPIFAREVPIKWLYIIVSQLYANSTPSNMFLRVPINYNVRIYIWVWVKIRYPN